MPKISRGNLFTQKLGIFLDTLTQGSGVCAGARTVSCTQALLGATMALMGVLCAETPRGPRVKRAPRPLPQHWDGSQKLEGVSFRVKRHLDQCCV